MPRPETPVQNVVFTSAPPAIPTDSADKTSEDLEAEKLRLQEERPNTTDSTSHCPEVAAFDTWLQNVLSTERASLVARIHDRIERQLANHHHELCKAVFQQDADVDAGDGAVPAQQAFQKFTGPVDPVDAAHASFCSDWSRRNTSASGGAAASQAVASQEPGDLDNKGTTDSKKTGFEFKGLTFESRGGSWSTKSSHAYKSHFIASLVTKSLSNMNLTVGVQGFVNWVVSSHYFELIVSALIMVNLMVTALEVQYVGCRVGHSLGHEDCADPKDNTDLMMEDGFNIMAVVFTAWFGLEFILRMIHHGRAVFRMRWMWFDFFCLVFGVADTVTRISETNLLMINPTVMRVTRIIRMLRIVKFFRSREVFQTLFLLMKSILASRHTLVWFILILYITVTVIGLLLNQLLYPYLSDNAESIEERRVVYEYFGTYSRMLVTMFEITLGNWPTPTRVLMVHVGQWWGIFVVVYRCVFCFSLVNTTLAVFINETSRVAADDQVQMIHKLRRDKKTEETLTELFKEIDSSEDGLISWDELREAAQDKVMMDIMDIHGFDIQDVEELFHLMDKGDGKVPQQRIVHGIMRFSGTAKGSRQLAILRLVRGMDMKLSSVSDELAALKRWKY